MIDDFGFTFWKGHFVDRLSPDCSLHPILPFHPQNNFTNSINSPSHSDLDYHLFSKEGNHSNTQPIKSLFEQFPCKTNLTKDLSVHNQKASIVRSLFRTSVGNHCLLYERPCYKFSPNISKLSYGGRFQNNGYFHSLNESNFEIFMEYLARSNNVNNYQSIRDSIYVNKSNSTILNGGIILEYVNDFQLEVNHFKWTSSLRSKLTKRFRDYTELKLSWANESNSILEYFNEDGTTRKLIEGCPCRN